MIFPLKARLITTSLCVAAAAFASETNPTPFAEAHITQVVNQVSIIESESLTKTDAAVDQIFQAPNILETGRRSRAELMAQDGTVTRVGSNTLFSFEPTKREINLERGSVLFHSPSGMGGGQIVTDAATASVVGTTIIVAATTDGGFKILCLEGRARVQFADGTVTFLNAGQLTFVLPGIESATNENQSAGEPGPVLDFDLERMTGNSFLLDGFDSDLASQDKIQLETRTQQNKIANGELGETNTVILGANSRDEIILADGTIVENAIEISKRLNHANRSSVAAALSKDVTFTETIPSEISDNRFASPTRVTSDQNAFLGNANSPFGNDYQGVIARNIIFNSDQFDLSSLALDGNQVDFAASENIVFNTDIMTFYGTAGIERVRLTTPSIFFNESSSEYDSFNTDFVSVRSGHTSLILLAENKTAFLIDLLGDAPLSIDDSSLYNTYGPLEFLVREGDIELNYVSITTSNNGDTSILPYSSTDLPGTTTPALTVAPTAFASTSETELPMDPADITLSGSGNLSITNSTFQAYNSSIRIGEVESNNSPTPKQILMEGSQAYANRLKLIAQDRIDFNNNSIDAIETKLTAENLSLSGNSFYTYNLSTDVVRLELNAGNTIDFINHTDLSSLTEIWMAAREINLQDVHFSEGTQVHFKTEAGMVYVGGKMPGHVNFINNVTYGSDYLPAEYYVDPAYIASPLPTDYVNLGTPITVSALSSSPAN